MRRSSLHDNQKVGQGILELEHFRASIELRLNPKLVIVPKQQVLYLARHLPFFAINIATTQSKIIPGALVLILHIYQCFDKYIRLSDQGILATTLLPT